ncbi:uncharacterized protein FIBRA_08973 [Fibroporia radiculosa]|uniref:Uncharacterized protein n=1 Tax=Fibroporia radiculosa TaxID=599839 RepID=J4ICM8_9APHY|nr:uncharacterized protein FIBRA_08973 [Fibroporia radiculosa]CCM06686.1 predicted protein [Fibroporia radiculosa]
MTAAHSSACTLVGSPCNLPARGPLSDAAPERALRASDWKPLRKLGKIMFLVEDRQTRARLKVVQKRDMPRRPRAARDAPRASSASARRCTTRTAPTYLLTVRRRPISLACACPDRVLSPSPPKNSEYMPSGDLDAKIQHAVQLVCPRPPPARTARC